MIAPSALVFPRHRLYARLDALRRAPLTLVVASPQSGKSTAVRGYLGARGIAHVCIDASPELAGPAAFLRAFAAALGSLVPALPSSAAGIAARFARGDDDAAVLAWACEHLRAVETTVVVDDMQSLAGEPRTVDFLRGVIDATIPRVRWMLIGRDAAAFPVARWLANGVTDLPVDDDDLRIDLDELRAVARDAGLRLADDVLHALERETSPRPLRLAVALATGHVDESGSAEQLYDGLVDAALAARDELARDRLYESALLGHVDAPVLRALGHDAEQTIDELRDCGFAYAEANDAYAYHEPYRERLLARIDTLDAAHRDTLLARTAAALETTGRWTDAIVLHLRAGDTQRIARSLAARGFRALDVGDVAAVRDALAVLPEDVLTAHPVALAMKAAVASLDERFDIAEAWFRIAIDAATAHARREIVIRFGVDLVRRERPDAAALLEPETADGGDAKLWGLLGTAYVAAHRMTDAREAARQALQRLGGVDDDGVRARIFHQAAFVALNDDDLVSARDLAERALALADAAYLDDLAARALSVLHNLAMADDDSTTARRVLLRLGECGRKAGSTTLRLYALLNSYELEVDAGNVAAIERIDAELRGLQVVLTPMTGEALLPAQALRASWEGRFEHAYQLLAPNAERQFGEDRQAHRWAEAAMYAAAAGLRAQSSDAIRRSRAGLRKTGSSDRDALRAQAYLAIAEILLAHHGRARGAIAELRAASRRASPRFVALVDAIRALFHRWSTGWHTAPSLSEALERLERVDLGGIARFIGALPLPSTERARIGLLSETEKAILRYVAAGSTSKEIAADLNRSPHTIDVHIRTICRKLGCSGRRQAVAFAIREGLVTERRQTVRP